MSIYVTSGLLYLLFIHFYFLSIDSALAELAASHIPVVLVASSAADAADAVGVRTVAPSAADAAALGRCGCGGMAKRRILPVLYRQTTPTRWALTREKWKKHGKKPVFFFHRWLEFEVHLEDCEGKYGENRTNMQNL